MSLLNSYKLFDVSGQSMSIDVTLICAAASGDCQLKVIQTIDMGLDIQRSKRPRGTLVVVESREPRVRGSCRGRT